ncbi:MAG TPA: hypothetical protein PKW15_04275 [Alphaproteobacteria bacterium]|nr:hypothetical protein [Rhodospirillaceae bacterium]HRJ12445.1 hypothetical protein [Alphaproteobacteria bacterium]
MIFAIFILLIFASMVAFVQFGQPENSASPRAQLYAQNMSIWHQAAMLEIKNTAALPPAIVNCPGSGNCPAVFMNSRLWQAGSKKVNGALYNQWREYQPMVPISATAGWQSYYIRQVNGDDGNLITGNNDAYILTVFRGFGGGSRVLSVGSEKGALDESAFIKSLTSAVTDRSGIGMLSCNAVTRICEFKREAFQVNPGATGITKDDSRKFSTRTFMLMGGVAATYFPPGGTDVDAANSLHGRPAILTRVEN